jgi:gag-polypeptide of LTR copia-type
MLVYIMSLAMSKEVWDVLKGLLETQGVLRIVLAWQKLFRSQCADDMLIEEHIWILCSYQEELHNLRQKINGKKFSIILLTSLPESWNNYIASIDTTVLKDSQKLIACMLEQDQWLGIRNLDDTALTCKHGKRSSI